MNQLSRAAMKWSRLIETARSNRRLPSTLFTSPKLFTTGAAEPSVGFSGNQFLETPRSGLVYGKLNNITKHTTKSDIINLLEGSSLNLEKLKVEYDRSYQPTSVLVEFPSSSAYDAALRAIGRKGRILNVNMTRTDKSQWDIAAGYDAKAILLHGIPRNALIDDVERFLSGCQYDAPSIQMFVRPTNQGLIRMALVRFSSQALAMHAFITKNRGFCLNNQITLRRERIAKRIRALQELVPSVNKTDRAVMLDEIVDYVKFLKLQVKVLSMSRMGGAGAVAPLVTDIPISSSVEGEGHEGGRAQPAREKWSNDGTERHVAKLMEENVGAAMQLLQSKELCIMPISLASAIYHTQTPEMTIPMKPESNHPS